MYAAPQVVRAPSFVPTAEYADDEAARSGKVILARALSSGSAGLIVAASPVPAAAVPVPAAPVRAVPARSRHHQPGTFAEKFVRFDELGNLLSVVGNATSARQQGEQALAAATKAYDETEKALIKNRASQPRAERRLHRNAHPRFLHYFQLNREQKVKRLEKELQALRDDERRLDEKKADLTRQVEQRRKDLGNLQATESQMKSAQAERQALFDSVVDSQPPTPLLSSLMFQLQNSENEHRTEVQLLNQVENCLRQVEGARQLFNRAHQKLRQALNMNLGAGVVNIGQALDRRNRNGFGADNFAERGLQMRRDMLLNEARDIALRAGDQLQMAFDSFPMEARVRYPEFTANICNAPLPNLRGANFFGTMAGNFGDAMNDMYAQQKISHNLQALLQCEQIAAVQASAVQTVVINIKMRLGTIEDECRRLQASVKAERQSIFETTRRQVFGR